MFFWCIGVSPEFTPSEMLYCKTSWWWFQCFLILSHTTGHDPIWLHAVMFLKWVVRKNAKSWVNISPWLPYKIQIKIQLTWQGSICFNSSKCQADQCSCSAFRKSIKCIYGTSFLYPSWCLVCLVWFFIGFFWKEKANPPNGFAGDEAWC